MHVLSTVVLAGNALVLAMLAVVAAASAQYVWLFVLQRWRRRVTLPDPCGFADLSVASGGPLRLYIHSTAACKVTLLRLGAGIEKVDELELPTPDSQSSSYDHWHGFAWHPSLTIDTTSLSPGLHVAVVNQLDQAARRFRIPFIVRKHRCKIVVIASTNTWHAYNDFAGLSNYVSSAVPVPLRPLLTVMKAGNWRLRLSAGRLVPSIPLPAARPLLNIDRDLACLESEAGEHFSHLCRGEWNLIGFLEREGVDYGLMTDHDFAVGRDRLAGADALLFNTHSEYWSEEMIGRLARCIEDGVSVAFLSGNNIYRHVRHTRHGCIVDDQMQNGEGVAALIGASYDPLGYKTYGGYVALAPNHWVFDGAGLGLGGRFGIGQPSGSGGGRTRGGASGYETDKIRPSSKAFVVLAVGDNAEGPAYMVYRDTVLGGWIFNAASVAFTSWIGHDPVVDRLLRNLVAAASRRVAGHGNVHG